VAIVFASPSGALGAPLTTSQVSAVVRNNNKQKEI